MRMRLNLTIFGQNFVVTIYRKWGKLWPRWQANLVYIWIFDAENWAKFEHIFYKYLCSLIKFIHDYKKNSVGAKILRKFALFNCFFRFPIKFDKEKWYYMYIKQLLKHDAFLIFCHNFVVPISNLVVHKEWSIWVTSCTINWSNLRKF